MGIREFILSIFISAAPQQHTPPESIPAPPVVAKIAPAPQIKPLVAVDSPMGCMECSISDAGLALIRSFEGYSAFVYKDAVGLPTIGFGHLIKPGEKFREPLIPVEAESLLRTDVAAKEAAVNKFVDVPLYQGQFDAVTSFTFNLGAGALKSSTLLKRVNAAAHGDVPPQLRRWNKAGGKVLRGLVLRREAEAVMYQMAEGGSDNGQKEKR